MAFAHLSQARLQELRVTFETLPIAYDAPTRAILLAGVDPQFVGLLPIGLPPSLQLLSDLSKLNMVERLVDGSVPLRSWLENAAGLASGTNQAAVFLRALDDVTHRVSGAPRLDVTALPEAKEVLIHENDMVPFGFMAEGLAAAKAVAKLSVPRFENGQQVGGAKPVPYLGTAWLITPDLLMTAHHVVNARNEGEANASEADLTLQALAATVTFDFNGTAAQGQDSAVSALVAWEPTLDYAVLRIPPSGRTPLRIAGQRLTKQQDRDLIPVNVIQHPQGTSKKYAIRNNLVSRTSNAEIRYFTDTLNGSSGAPVFDDRWNVVGLHRGATFTTEIKSFQGRPAAWVNSGTQIRAIIDDITARYPALASEL